MQKKIKIAIDSPAAAGAGTLAKSISKYYNLYYLDTGKIYRYIASITLKFPKKWSYALLNKKINSLKIHSLLGQFIGFKLFVLLTLISEIASPL